MGPRCSFCQWLRGYSTCLSVTAGAIHQMVRSAPTEEEGKVFVEHAREVLGSVGTGDVRGDGDVVEGPQRVIGRQRLGREDVEHGAGDAPRSERAHERILVDERAAAEVEEP